VAKAGLRKLQRYSLEFKVTAVRLSQQPGIQVAGRRRGLDIHPFMLSKWRKEVRLRMLRGKGDGCSALRSVRFAGCRQWSGSRAAPPGE
jgi:transposase-like protein